MWLPHDQLFPACIAELDTALCPLHYKTLTQRAIANLLLEPRLPIPKQAIEDLAEEVREKLLQAAWHGIPFYTYEDGGCLGGLRSWFKLDQGELFNSDRVIIPGHAQRGADGAFEALQRRDYLLVKNPRSTQASRDRANGSGHVLEHHVTAWFAEKYPSFYRPKNNIHNILDYTDHDFKLALPLGTFKVDVAGPNRRDNKWHPSDDKPRTDIHLICRIEGQDVLWYGVRRKENFHGVIIPETASSSVRFLVWLNCLQAGLDYGKLAKYAQLPGKRS